MALEKWDDLVKAGLEVKKSADYLELIVLLRNMQLRPGFICEDVDNILIGNCGHYIACSPERFEEVFNTKLRIYGKDGKKCYEMLKPALIPSQLEKHIARVEIINDFKFH